MIIDKLGNKTYTEHELRYLAQAEIASKISPESEANIARKLDGMNSGLYTPTIEELQDIGNYKNILEEVQVSTAQAIIDNQLLIKAINYEQALQRLTQYKLSVGRPERTVYKTDMFGNQEVDYVVPAIEPIEAIIEQPSYSEEGEYLGITEITNPRITQDEDEREAAQQIIDNAAQEVLDLYAIRNPT